MHLAVDGSIFTHRIPRPDSLHWWQALAALADLEPSVEITLVSEGGLAESLPNSSPWRHHQITGRGGAFQPHLYFHRDLPRTAQSVGAEVLFVPYHASPLLSPLPTICVLETTPPKRRRSILNRLKVSMERAGLQGAEGIFRLDDLGNVEESGNFLDLPPWVADGFRPAGEGDGQVLKVYQLETDYVLCHGLMAEEVPALLSAWTWVDPSAGVLHPLVLLDPEGAAAERMKDMADHLDLSETIHFRDLKGVDHLPALYRSASVYLSISGRGIGQPLRWSLAVGTPVAGVRTPMSSAVLGEAGYLVEGNDSRGLGAACLSLLVEREISAKLRQQGLIRARRYHGEEPLLSLFRCMEEVVR